jgi:hypothetical protein
MTTPSDHRIRWFGIISGTGERVPRNRHMNGGDWGWDAECSCGWQTRTGGAIQERIREAIADHRWDIAHPIEVGRMSV